MRGLSLTIGSGGLCRVTAGVIDAFEDSVYDLRVIPTDGPLPVWSYTCPITSEARAAPDWDRDEFTIRHLASYVAMCREWRRST